MTRRASFVVALTIGVVLAVIGLVLGLIGMLAALVAALLTLVNYGWLAFAGIATGIGGAWTVEFVLAAQNCARPDQPCGATPIDLTPHIAISVAVLTAGVVAAMFALRRPDGEIKAS